MKKLLALLMVLGLATTVMAVPGEVGFMPVGEGHGFSPDDPLEASETVYIDILMYSTMDYLAINSTGSIYVDLVGPAVFVGNEDYTYYPDFEYRPAGTPPPVPPPPEWLGFNAQVVRGPQSLELAGGLPPTISHWLIGGPGLTAMVFDHIGIHCTGEGEVQVIVSVEQSASQFGVPVITSTGTLYEDFGALGGELTIYQPEPMTMGLLSLGGLAILRRRR
jgi:hypothetical protein